MSVVGGVRTDLDTECVGAPHVRLAQRGRGPIGDADRCGVAASNEQQSLTLGLHRTAEFWVNREDFVGHQEVEVDCSIGSDAGAERGQVAVDGALYAAR